MFEWIKEPKFLSMGVGRGGRLPPRGWTSWNPSWSTTKKPRRESPSSLTAPTVFLLGHCLLECPFRPQDQQVRSSTAIGGFGHRSEACSSLQLGHLRGGRVPVAEAERDWLGALLCGLDAGPDR